MTNVVFKLVMYTFLFNIAIGIMLTLFPTIYGLSGGTGLSYQENKTNLFTNNMQEIITPSGEAEDAGNQIYRVLDLTIIGFIERAMDTIKTYLYGFVQLLDLVIGREIAEENLALRNFLFKPPFGAFYTIITIGYIYGAFYLWTGKDLMG